MPSELRCPPPCESFELCVVARFLDLQMLLGAHAAHLHQSLRRICNGRRRGRGRCTPTVREHYVRGVRRTKVIRESKDFLDANVARAAARRRPSARGLADGGGQADRRTQHRRSRPGWLSGCLALHRLFFGEPTALFDRTKSTVPLRGHRHQPFHGGCIIIAASVGIRSQWRSSQRGAITLRHHRSDATSRCSRCRAHGSRTGRWHWSAHVGHCSARSWPFSGGASSGHQGL